jgi:hypothetical protein
MKVSIQSLKCDLLQYKRLLERKVDWDKHLNVAFTWDNPITKEVMQNYELRDVEVNSAEELFNLFSEFDEGMGPRSGHITIDVAGNIVYILDTWIE